ncbi:hypothetical protein GGTG_10513 [Gaeumannomyces tritici R3-111a-1]|uniref:Uncharacterized protein n=1 Tax=Gaeumannomyces tritici (strain R3-111a-1) TaxID=644352 RepID=J3PAI8_GAET3|nr:hypothetical protein GGTG_10513 [Gaeumannomyces tritici R3-111a-1]EJT71254.1 hypothetical protein GGTG_10513 [Gaeumannomyces tritici R3-111a-1]
MIVGRWKGSAKVGLPCFLDYHIGKRYPGFGLVPITSLILSCLWIYLRAGPEGRERLRMIYTGAVVRFAVYGILSAIFL